MKNPVLAAGSLFIGFLLLTFLVVIPRGSEVRAMHEDLSAAEDSLASLEAEVAALRAAEEVGVADEQLAEIRRSIPATPDLPALIDDLLEAASLAGVTLNSVAPGTPTPASADLASIIPLSLGVSGGYFALASFLDQLERMERLTKVTAISISSDGSAALSMQVSAEVYTTDLSAGPGSDPAPGPEIGA